jgi:hypothetical protein
MHSLKEHAKVLPKRRGPGRPETPRRSLDRHVRRVVWCRMEQSIHYRAIGYFEAVRRWGSIREAARRLDVAASAVNRQILKFETDFGLPLFKRLPEGMRLTPAGEISARHAVAVLQDEQRLASEVKRSKGCAGAKCPSSRQSR